MNSRYSRQVILEQIGHQGQEKLLQSHVIVIGCGALGSTIAGNLARAGIGNLTVLDRDLVEKTNLHRQTLFNEDDIGSPKAPVAAQKLAKINSEIQINYHLKDLHNTNAQEIFLGNGPKNRADLVIDATDNIPTRMLINDVCVKHRIPWIYGGAIQTGGMVMNILPDGPCFRCLIPELPSRGNPYLRNRRGTQYHPHHYRLHPKHRSH